MSEQANPSISIVDEGPKITFLETFYGILFNPKELFDDLDKEDTFTILTYGALSILLASLGKLGPNDMSIINIIGAEFIGIISWVLIGVLILFFSIVFKTPNNNFGRLLGFTGIAHLPFILMSPIALLSIKTPFVYNFLSIIMFVWTFILFCIALSKSLKLEAWRVFLLAIIPFLIGITSNIFGLIVSGVF